MKRRRRLVTSQIQAANELGVTPRTLARWRLIDTFPDCRRGYDLKAINAWRDEHGRKGSQYSEVMLKLRVATLGEKLKQAVLQVRSDQLGLQAAEGKLIPTAAVKASIDLILNTLQQWRATMPQAAAEMLPKRLRPKYIALCQREFDKLITQTKSDLGRITERLPAP